jgi:hypothetical protein
MAVVPLQAAYVVANYKETPLTDAENYFSIFKGGVYGTYHHISEQHLARYLAEFDFRYNNRTGFGINDRARADKLLKGITGKRLTYKRPNEAAHA